VAINVKASRSNRTVEFNGLLRIESIDLTILFS